MRFQYECTCRHPHGLTLLEAVLIVRSTLRSHSGVRFEANGHCANGMDINGLMSLPVESGDVVKVTAEGQDAYDLVKEIESVLIHDTDEGKKPVGQRRVPDLVSALG